MRRYLLKHVLLALTLPVVAAASAAEGCAAVPDIRFVEEDARADSSRVEGGTDGAVVDVDAGPTTCVATSPGAGATCCGTVWCLGDCGGANCAACESSPCSAVEVCCGRPQGMLCKRGACN